MQNLLKYIHRKKKRDAIPFDNNIYHPGAVSKSYRLFKQFDKSIKIYDPAKKIDFIISLLRIQ